MTKREQIAELRKDLDRVLAFLRDVLPPEHDAAEALPVQPMWEPLPQTGTDGLPSCWPVDPERLPVIDPCDGMPDGTGTVTTTGVEEDTECPT